MSRKYPGECKFIFKVTGYMNDAPSKVKTAFYKTQIKLALSNANIEIRDVDVFFEE